jgi:hypothetical protein
MDPGAPLLRLGVWLAACAWATAIYYFHRVLSPDWQKGRPFLVAAIFWVGVIGPPFVWRDS